MGASQCTLDDEKKRALAEDIKAFLSVQEKERGGDDVGNSSTSRSRYILDVRNPSTDTTSSHLAPLVLLSAHIDTIIPASHETKFQTLEVGISTRTGMIQKYIVDGIDLLAPTRYVFCVFFCIIRRLLYDSFFAFAVQ
jgi:hypothetical protein